jgi:hypothetical protein
VNVEFDASQVCERRQQCRKLLADNIVAKVNQQAWSWRVWLCLLIATEHCTQTETLGQLGQHVTEGLAACEDSALRQDDVANVCGLLFEQAPMCAVCSLSRRHAGGALRLWRLNASQNAMDAFVVSASRKCAACTRAANPRNEMQTAGGRCKSPEQQHYAQPLLQKI